MMSCMTWTMTSMPQASWMPRAAANAEQASAGVAPVMGMLFSMLATHVALQSAWESLLSGSWLDGLDDVAVQEQKREPITPSFSRKHGSVVADLPDGRRMLMPQEFVLQHPDGRQTRVSTQDQDTRGPSVDQLHFQTGPRVDHRDAHGREVPTYWLDEQGRIYDKNGKQPMDLRTPFLHYGGFAA